MARTLDELEGLVTEDDQGVSEVADYLGERRRELFPNGAAETGGEDTSASDGASAASAETDDESAEDRTSQRTLDARGDE